VYLQESCLDADPGTDVPHDKMYILGGDTGGALDSAPRELVAYDPSRRRPGWAGTCGDHRWRQRPERRRVFCPKPVCSRTTLGGVRTTAILSRPAASPYANRRLFRPLLTGPFAVRLPSA
jgi:hypothetical protein